MAAEKEPTENLHTVLSNFFHKSKLLVRGQVISLTAKEAAPHVAAKLITPAK
jgi:hypothetical protein